MDSDKVLVMDAGQAVEFDHPHVLLRNPNGYFSKMVEQTGPIMAAKLKSIAQNAYETSNKIPDIQVEECEQNKDDKDNQANEEIKENGEVDTTESTP